MKTLFFLLMSPIEKLQQEIQEEFENLGLKLHNTSRVSLDEVKQFIEYAVIRAVEWERARILKEAKYNEEFFHDFDNDTYILIEELERITNGTPKV